MVVLTVENIQKVDLALSRFSEEFVGRFLYDREIYPAELFIRLTIHATDNLSFGLAGPDHILRHSE